MKHELKIWPQYFCRVLEGTKTFEVRRNDREFQAGDEVVLREWNQDACPRIAGRAPRRKTHWTGRQARFRIGYVLQIALGQVVFSLLPLEREEDEG